MGLDLAMVDSSFHLVLVPFLLACLLRRSTSMMEGLVLVSDLFSFSAFNICQNL